MRVWLLIALAILCVPLVAAEPDWFRNPSQTEYSVETHWFGVGNAAQLKRAIDEAKATLAGQIETTISQKTTMTDSETRVGSVSQYRRSRQSEIRSTIRQTLANAQIVKQVKDRGGYYVLVVLDKAQYRSGLYSQLQQLNRDLNTELLYQGLLESAQRYDKALDKFDALLAKAKDYDTLVSLYNYVSPEPFLPQHSGLTLTDIQGKKTAYVSEFSLELDTQVDVSMALGKQSDSPVRLRMRWKDNPVTNFVIRVAYGDATVLGDYTTDASGYVEFQPYGLPLSASDQYVTAEVHLQGRAQQWQADMPASLKIPYTVRDLRYTPITLVVESDDRAWDKHLNRPLRSAFSALGYSVENSGTISVQVRIDVENEKTMGSYQKNNYYMAGSLVLTANHNGQASMAPVAIPFKALAKNRKKAIQKIADDVVFPKIRLLELLASTGGIE
jgi:hypothetical protein